MARPYNIYVFPEDNVGNSFLNCETGAIIFNRDHGMDFNKWIHKGNYIKAYQLGIPYMNVKQENNFLENISDGDVNFYNPSDPQKFKNISLFKEEDRSRYNDFCKIFSEFLYSEHKCWMFEKYPKYFIYYIMNNLSENMRKRLYFSHEQLEGKSCLMISKLDDNEKKKKIEDAHSSRVNEVNKKKGVKRLFEAIIRKRSVLVGHNFNLDVLFIISHFGDPLPASLKEYKELLKKYFSNVYDTKYLFENLSQEYKDMQLSKDMSPNLENIYTQLKSMSSNLNVSIEIHKDMSSSYNLESNSYHEASFDAYVTGCAFVWMTQLSDDKIDNLSNRIYLMKSIYSCINVNADENYAVPDVKYLL